MSSDNSDGGIQACLAKALLLNDSTIPQLSWIVNDCFQQLEVNDWNCELKNAGSSNHELRISHRLTGEKRHSHPILDVYRELSYRVQTAISANQDHHDSSNSLNSTLTGLSCFDSALSGVALIKFLNYILSHLNINPRSEYYVVDVIVHRLENHRNLMSEKALLEGVSRGRACFFRYSTDNSISLCNRCGKDPSSGICFECGDFLCSACTQTLHSRGSRQDHCITKFEQQICSECSQRLALAWCINCGDMFCDTCYSNLHSTKHRHLHTIELPYTSLCSECRNSDANGYCETCLRAMCCDCGHGHQSAFSNHSWSDNLRSDKIEILVALFQKTQWTRSATLSRHGLVAIADPSAPLWYDFVLRKVCYEKPDVSRNDLHAIAVDAILKRSKLIKHGTYHTSS